MVSNRGWSTDKCVSNQLCGFDLYPLHSSPYEGLFRERLQSRTGAPPTSEPWPPAVPAWNSLWGCVRSGRLSWPSLSDPYTPPGTFSNTAPPVGSWKDTSADHGPKHPPKTKAKAVPPAGDAAIPLTGLACPEFPTHAFNHCLSAVKWAFKSMHIWVKAP